jgi:predicted kinase
MLYILRGISGSGKSTLAKKLKTLAMTHYEADMFFMKDGLYVFDASKLALAHAWCQESVENDLMYKMDVIVSNTFTTIKEMKPYFEMAKAENTQVQVITCQSAFKNVHNVPEEVLQKQAARFATDLTPLFEILK